MNRKESVEIDKLKSINSNIREVVIHIGLPKTATTSIQSTLYKNSALLEKTGTLYPLSIWQNHGRHFKHITSREPQNLIINILAQRKFDEIKDMTETDHNHLIGEITKKNPSRIIFSAEYLFEAAEYQVDLLKEYIALFADEANIRIVVCVRDPIGFNTSYIQEKIKSYGRGKIDSDIDENLYFNSISKYVKKFGKQNVSVYSFEDSIKHRYGPAGYFMEHIGISSSIIAECDFINLNESIKREAVILIDSINNECPLIDVKENHISLDRNRYDLDLIKLIGEQNFFLSEKKQREILRITKDDAVWLKENFLIDYTSSKIKRPYEQKLITKKAIEDISLICRDMTKFVTRGTVNALENALLENEVEEEAVNSTKLVHKKMINHLKMWDLVERDELSENQQAQIKRYYKKGKHAVQMYKNFIMYLNHRAKGFRDFDGAHYKDMYLKNRKIKTPPLLHYLIAGAYLGYNPSKEFNTVAYILSHEKIIDSGENPLVYKSKIFEALKS